MYKDWLKIYGEIRTHAGEKIIYPCPHCGKPQLDFQYVGDVVARKGYLAIWCNNCNHGVNLSRVEIPEAACVLSFEISPDSISKRIPDFVQVTPIA
jgi:hypothetical protein